MSLQLGETAPDFTLDSTQGPIRLHDYIGDHWLVFFSHPKDFTPVCTTELGAFARRQREFERRRTRLLGLSVDAVDDHRRWTLDVHDVGGAAVAYPIVADPDLEVARLYGMFHPKADPKVTVRSVFVIDPQKKGAPEPHLSAQRRPQHRRDPARARLAAAHRRPQARHAGGLAARRRGDHRALGVRRGRPPALSRGLEDGEALPAPGAHAAALARARVK